MRLDTKRRHCSPWRSAFLYVAGALGRDSLCPAGREAVPGLQPAGCRGWTRGVAGPGPGSTDTWRGASSDAPSGDHVWSSLPGPRVDRTGAPRDSQPCPWCARRSSWWTCARASARSRRRCSGCTTSRPRRSTHSSGGGRWREGGCAAWLAWNGKCNDSLFFFLVFLEHNFEITPFGSFIDQTLD